MGSVPVQSCCTATGSLTVYRVTSTWTAETEGRVLENVMGGRDWDQSHDWTVVWGKVDRCHFGIVVMMMSEGVHCYLAMQYRSVTRM